MNTSLEIRAEILSDLWLNYRADEEFQDFIQYNDLGLPVAYLISAGLVKQSEEINKFVNEAFDLLLAGFDIEEDTGFENLDDLLGAADLGEIDDNSL